MHTPEQIAESWGWFKLKCGWYHPLAEQYVGYVGFPVCYATAEQLCKTEGLASLNQQLTQED